MQEAWLRPVERNVRPDVESVSFMIEGGRPLNGAVELSGAKNLSLQAVASSILSTEEVTLQNCPDILDVNVSLRLLSQMGAHVAKGDNDQVTINTADLRPHEIDPEDSLLTSGSRYLIPPLVRRFGRIVAGPPGGDNIGGRDRFRFGQEALYMYERLGIGSTHVESEDGSLTYEFYNLESNGKLPEITLSERFFGPTVQALLSGAVSGAELTLRNPNVEPEVMETIRLLNQMGADIAYEPEGFEMGEDSIHIKGKSYLSGGEFRIKSDPNVMVSYAVMALITDGAVQIRGVDSSSKVEAFLAILDQMGVVYAFDNSTLTLLPSRGGMRPVDLRTDFWPAQSHTDWQQILTPLLATLPGLSIIDENVYPTRFTSVAALEQMGASLDTFSDSSRITRREFLTDGRPHSLRIEGPTVFSSANIYAPNDVRGATGVLAAMLAADGVSRLDNARQVLRGVEDVDSVLRSLGANIT